MGKPVKTKVKAPGVRRRLEGLQGRVDEMAETIANFRSMFICPFVLSHSHLKHPDEKQSVKRKRAISDETDDTVPKPIGRPGKGRGLGYNLQEEMGLKARSQVYNGLQDNIRKHAAARGIDVTKTIKNTSGAIVERFVAWCNVQWPIFRQFEDGWAIKAILGEYLIGQKAASKQRQKAMDIESSGWEADVDSELLSSPPRKKVRREVLNTKASTSKKVEIVDAEYYMGSDENEKDISDSDDLHCQSPAFPPALPPSKARSLKVSKQSTSSNLNTGNHLNLVEDTFPSQSPSPAQPVRIRKIPYYCPSFACPDEVPANPSDAIVSLCEKRDRLVHKHGDKSDQVSNINVRICFALKAAKQNLVARQRATADGYHHISMFDTRVLTMKLDLDRFMLDGPNDRNETHVWSNLLSEIPLEKLSLLNKGKKILNKVYEEAQLGAYGERGGAVIKNTLMRMYSLISLSQISPASDPLTLDAYITYFVAPHIISTLVAEDKDENLEGGWEAMQPAQQNGLAFNKLLDDDPELDNIFQENAVARVRASRAPAKPQPFPGKRMRPARGPLHGSKAPEDCVEKKKPTTEPRQTRANVASAKAVKIVTAADFPMPSPTTKTNWKVSNVKKEKMLSC
ncbi:hypothetical protein FIBSPDRAFT_894438 [Athelia psychrophila]|uniref:Restriction of telomere capping protein 4 C-terminal domain-containing protein n=1 Tax=Athelia psychrophila TaxID=1759441 RepID=A0A166FUJ7_9AGAM|nr:hypothetical protein FIBSPDRAFT_894438 [Fibularhizoctonia sp. CBS 109695]